MSKKGSETMSAERFKNVTSLEIDDLLNNKTIILLNLAEYRYDSPYLTIVKYGLS